MSIPCECLHFLLIHRHKSLSIMTRTRTWNNRCVNTLQPNNNRRNYGKAQTAWITSKIESLFLYIVRMELEKIYNWTKHANRGAAVPWFDKKHTVMGTWRIYTQKCKFPCCFYCLARLIMNGEHINLTKRCWIHEKNVICSWTCTRVRSYFVYLGIHSIHIHISKWFLLNIHPSIHMWGAVFTNSQMNAIVKSSFLFYTQYIKPDVLFVWNHLHQKSLNYYLTEPENFT
jgi:hypothetical protein